MDISVVIAVVAAVLLVGLVWFLARRREPSLPKQTEPGAELPATSLPAEPPAPAAALPRATRVSEAPPVAAPEVVPTPSAAPAASEHERDVAAIRRGLANTRGGFIARLAKLFGARKEIDPSLIEEIEEVL